MNSSEPDAAGLAGFRERLRGGIYPAVTASRPADLEFRDDQALQGWPGDALRSLGSIRADSWGADGEPGKTINGLAARMRATPPLLAAVLFSPHVVLNRLLESHRPSETPLVDSWTGMCWAAEAAWNAAGDDLPVDAGYADGDAGLLRPLAARLRFLVLSEPSRWRADAASGWWARVPDRIPGGNRVLNRAFGPASWHVLIKRSTEARREWQGFLDAYQSHPLLSQSKPNEVEQELQILVLRNVRSTPSRRLTPPLGLSVKPLAEPSPLTAEDKAVIADVAERHLLPRFAIPAVARLSLYDDDPRWRGARVLASIAVALAGLATVGLAAGLLIHQATIGAAVFYLLVCAGVVAFGSNWAGIWLLRMPAAAAVGVIALVTFLPGDWLHRPADGWLAVLALGAASYGYLVVEARNHGVAGWASPRRALAVAAAGAAHALMVSLIGLVVVAPAFVSNGPGLASLWRHPGYRQAGMELALATAWCLAVGVFSQILWDDRPITAPLAHLSWRARS